MLNHIFKLFKSDLQIAHEKREYNAVLYAIKESMLMKQPETFWDSKLSKAVTKQLLNVGYRIEVLIFKNSPITKITHNA